MFNNPKLHPNNKALQVITKKKKKKKKKKNPSKDQPLRIIPSLHIKRTKNCHVVILAFIVRLDTDHSYVGKNILNLDSIHNW